MAILRLGGLCLDLRLEIFRDCTAGGPRILLVVLAVKFLELALDAWVDLLEEFHELARGATGPTAVGLSVARTTSICMAV